MTENVVNQDIVTYLSFSQSKHVGAACYHLLPTYTTAKYLTDFMWQHIVSVEYSPFMGYGVCSDIVWYYYANYYVQLPDVT